MVQSSRWTQIMTNAMQNSGIDMLRVRCPTRFLLFLIKKFLMEQKLNFAFLLGDISQVVLTQEQKRISLHCHEL